MATDKRAKREIANSNERRRMQSINAGFQKLKRLLPVNDGEKLSKANILQHAAEFIQQIQREKLILYEQNTLIRGILSDVKGGMDVSKALDAIDLDALPTIPVSAHTIQDLNSDDNDEDSISATNKEDNKSANENGTFLNENSCEPPTTEVEISGDRVTDSQHPVVAKAAIALPLEVPYTSETAIDQHHPPSAARKMLKTDPQDPPKGQNLDTICKAIMEIEGTRIFKNDK